MDAGAAALIGNLALALATVGGAVSTRFHVRRVRRQITPSNGDTLAEIIEAQTDQLDGLTLGHRALAHDMNETRRDMWDLASLSFEHMIDGHGEKVDLRKLGHLAYERRAEEDARRDKDR